MTKSNPAVCLAGCLLFCCIFSGGCASGYHGARQVASCRDSRQALTAVQISTGVNGLSGNDAIDELRWYMHLSRASGKPCEPTDDLSWVVALSTNSSKVLYLPPAKRTVLDMFEEICGACGLKYRLNDHFVLIAEELYQSNVSVAPDGVESKLDSIRIPHFEFRGAALQDLLDFAVAPGNEHGTATGANLKHGFRVQMMDEASSRKTVWLKGTNLSLREFLSVVSQVADISFHATEDTIRCGSSSVPASAKGQQ